MKAIKHGPLCLFFVVFSFFASLPLLAAEERSLGAMGDWIGLEFSTVLDRFGPPKSIYPLRGLESWQDDVVFAYTEFELFFFENRVWQIRFFNLGEIPRNAPASVVRSLLGEPLFDHGTTWVYQRGGKAWPLRLRVDFTEDSREQKKELSMFYLYRADF